jgi:excisionase family DNA binding protein
VRLRGCDSTVEKGNHVDDRLLTILQTAEQFNLSTGLLYTAVARGELSAIRFRPRGRIRLREADVREWIEGHVSGAGFQSRGTAERHEGSSSAVSSIEQFLPPKALRRFA